MEQSPEVNSSETVSTKEKITPVATSSPIVLRARSISDHFENSDSLEELIRKAQQDSAHTESYENGAVMLIDDDDGPDSNYRQHRTFLTSVLVDARGGVRRGCRHSGVRIIVPPGKASEPIRVICRFLEEGKLANPPPLSDGEGLASRILEMSPAGTKFLGPIVLEVPHFASLRDREREIFILRSDDGEKWEEHQLLATEDAVQKVLNESFKVEDLSKLDDVYNPRITRILTNDFPLYFAVVTRIRQEVQSIGRDGGVIISSVVPGVKAMISNGALTKTIKVSLQAQPIPQEMVSQLYGNQVTVSSIVTVEPRRRQFHKPIILSIPRPQKGMQGQEPFTLRLLCSITGGTAPAEWEDITDTTELTFIGNQVSFISLVSARFWLIDCKFPENAVKMAQEIYNEAIFVPYMAKFAVFARRTFPVEGQLRVFCMTDDKEFKTLEKQEHFKLIAKSKDVEVLKGKNQLLEFSGNIVPIIKSEDQLFLFFSPFQKNQLALLVKTSCNDASKAETEGSIEFLMESKQSICGLVISLPSYAKEMTLALKIDGTSLESRYHDALSKDLPDFVHQTVLKGIGADWKRLGRALGVHFRDIQYIKHNYQGEESEAILKFWIHLKKEDANQINLYNALQQIGRDDIVKPIAHREPEALVKYSQAASSRKKREWTCTFMPLDHWLQLPREEQMIVLKRWEE